MSGFLRRHVVALVGASIVALMFGHHGGNALGAEEPPTPDDRKPEVRRSEARAIIREGVEAISQSAEENLGHGLTEARKDTLVDEMLQRIEDENVYSFVDQ